jgi:hypothetical protein
MRLDLTGGWVELLPIDELNRDHQDDLYDFREKLMEGKLAALPEPEPDPGNPAVMADPADRPAPEYTRADVRQIHDLVLGWIVKDASWPGMVPWTSEAGARMPLLAWNVLRKTMEAYFEVLNGSGPKETTEDTPTSAST